jgi:integrase
VSALHGALAKYIATRRALGTKLRWPAAVLRQFVDFVEAQGSQFVTTDVAVRWALKPVGVQQATHARRLEIVRGFAIWLQASDPRTQVPPQRILPAGQRRRAPHIYSDREIADLMAAADRLRSASGLRATTIKTLLGLLAATGLRPGEVLALDVDDVDLVAGILAVRDSKFGKSRLVPVDQSTRAALTTYAKFRDRSRPCRDTPAFFVSRLGTRLGAAATRRTFALLCQTVGLRPRLDGRHLGRGPRLQDVRHTFATRRLIEWYRAGLDADRLMPHLATYLGHVGLTETYWYIQAVPELLRLATERIEAAARGELR